MLEAPLGVKVVLKDGRTFYGPIWEWRGKEGWFSLVLDQEDAPDRFNLSDCAEAVDRKQRTNAIASEDVDLFERARSEGWTE